jgi:hypothetical protein
VIIKIRDPLLKDELGGKLAHMKKMRNAYNILVGSLKGRDLSKT